MSFNKSYDCKWLVLIINESEFFFIKSLLLKPSILPEWEFMLTPNIAAYCSTSEICCRVSRFGSWHTHHDSYSLIPPKFLFHGRTSFFLIEIFRLPKVAAGHIYTAGSWNWYKGRWYTYLKWINSKFLKNLILVELKWFSTKIP